MAPQPISLPLSLRLLRRLPIPHKLGVLERIYGRGLAPHGTAWVETAAGPLWKLNLRSSDHRWMVYGDYEGPYFIPWARAWLRQGGLVIDSGANIGQTLLHYGGIEGVRVLALEPNPGPRRWLEECVDAQQGWSVEIVPCGLSDANRTLPLRLPLFENEEDAQATLHQDWYKARNYTEVPVEVRPLDDVLAERKEDRVRLWKIDVEGWEDKALQGAARAMKERRIDAMYVELHPDNVASVQPLLLANGFSVWHIPRPGQLAPGIGPATGCHNVLALLSTGH